MNTSFQISKPNTVQKRSKSNLLNSALMYTSLICMPITASATNPNYDKIFEECGYENEASIIISDIYNLTRENLKHRLDLISKLTPNWDGYGAPAIGKSSIAKCKNVILSLSDNAIIDVKINPTEFGGTHLLYVNPIKKLKISVDFGDTAMSFYVLKGDTPPQFYSFLSYDDKNIAILTSLIESRIA